MHSMNKLAVYGPERVKSCATGEKQQQTCEVLCQAVHYGSHLRILSDVLFPSRRLIISRLTCWDFNNSITKFRVSVSLAFSFFPTRFCVPGAASPRAPGRSKPAFMARSGVEPADFSHSLGVDALSWMSYVRWAPTACTGLLIEQIRAPTKNHTSRWPGSRRSRRVVV